MRPQAEVAAFYLRQLKLHFPDQLALVYIDIDEPVPEHLAKAMTWAKEHPGSLPAVYVNGRIALSGRYTSRKVIELVRQELGAKK